MSADLLRALLRFLDDFAQARAEMKRFAPPPPLLPDPCVSANALRLGDRMHKLSDDIDREASDVVRNAWRACKWTVLDGRPGAAPPDSWRRLFHVREIVDATTTLRTAVLREYDVVHDEAMRRAIEAVGAWLEALDGGTDTAGDDREVVGPHSDANAIELLHNEARKALDEALRLSGVADYSADTINHARQWISPTGVWLIRARRALHDVAPCHATEVVRDGETLNLLARDLPFEAAQRCRAVYAVGDLIPASAIEAVRKAIGRIAPKAVEPDDAGDKAVDWIGPHPQKRLATIFDRSVSTIRDWVKRYKNGDRDLRPRIEKRGSSFFVHPDDMPKGA